MCRFLHERKFSVHLDKYLAVGFLGRTLSFSFPLLKKKKRHSKNLATAFQSGFLHNFCVLVFKGQFSSLNVTILFLGWILAICKYFYIWFAWFKISHQRKRWLRKKNNHILPRTTSEKRLLCPRYLSGCRAGRGLVQTCQRVPCVCRASSRAGPVTGSHLYSKQHSPMKGDRKEPIIVCQMLNVTRNIQIRWSHNTESKYNNSSPVSLCL